MKHLKLFDNYSISDDRILPKQKKFREIVMNYTKLKAENIINDKSLYALFTNEILEIYPDDIDSDYANEFDTNAILIAFTRPTKYITASRYSYNTRSYSVDDMKSLLKIIEEEIKHMKEFDLYVAKNREDYLMIFDNNEIVMEILDKDPTFYELIPEEFLTKEMREKYAHLGTEYGYNR